MMMDVFFDTVSGKRKRRVHFHRFMLELHQRLKLLQRQQDPLMQVSREIGQDVALLCLDEFFVSDIGDAMVLSQLLHGLANNGVTLVFTSNTKPDQLYKDGFQRDRFLPAIDLIKDRTVVAHLDGNTDYRLELLDRSDVYLRPNDAAAQSQMQSLFTHMVSTIPVTAGSITINDRRIQTRTHGEGVIWFEFNALCEGPRSKVDYVELSRSYHTILISGIPQLNDSQDDIVRRFIELIDELYDRRVKVIVSADSCPEDLYSGNRLSAPFNRTISRLNAFQSDAYLSLSHRP
jgi:cell division protein ZapE